MARHIKFSRTYPAHHPKAGQQTYFVEKFWKCLWDLEKINVNPMDGYFQKYDEVFPVTSDPKENIHLHLPKHHTIRNGHRWKKGDYFQPSVWGDDINPKSGRSGPYHSKSINIAPPTLITDVYDFKMSARLWIDECEFFLNHQFLNIKELTQVALNDGLDVLDLVYWFAGKGQANSKRKSFDGQVIIWNEKIKY